MKNLAENILRRNEAAYAEGSANARLRGAERDAERAVFKSKMAEEAIKYWTATSPPKPVRSLVRYLGVVTPRLILTVDGKGPSGKEEVPEEILTSLAELITEDLSLAGRLKRMTSRSRGWRRVSTETLIEGDNGSTAYVLWDISRVTREDANSVLWALLCLDAGTLELEDVYSPGGHRREISPTVSMTDVAVSALKQVMKNGTKTEAADPHTIEPVYVTDDGLDGLAYR
jgi:hypothetical protein